MIQEKILTKYNVYHATKHVQSDDDSFTERWEKYHLSTDTINIFGVKRFSLTLVGYGFYNIDWKFTKHMEMFVDVICNLSNL